MGNNKTDYLANKNMNAVARRMQSAVNSKVFPGAVLLVSHRDKILFHEAFGLSDIASGQLMKKDSIFDLASLTKPLATALCVMRLVEQGFVHVDETLAKIKTPERIWIDTIAKEGSGVCENNLIIGGDKADITLDQLLRHTSGLPAHRSFYETVMVEPESERQNLMRQLVFKEPLVAEPGKKQIYSDLGYIILAWVIEKVAGCKLDKFVREEIYQPLGIKDLFFIRINNKNRIRFNSKKYKLFVPTEICPWRKKNAQGRGA